MHPPLLAAPENLPGWPLHRLAERFHQRQHGDFDNWQQAVGQLPPIANPSASYAATVQVSGQVDIKHLQAQLMRLHPWRKGPFAIGGLTIDSEWRSDWKWARLQDHLQLRGHRILDIGCGNGYFGWRMLAVGAREVVGIDPTLLFCMQHQALQFYLQDHRNWVLPLKIEEIPGNVQFDSVFSMGVIYHRRDPQQHVAQLYALTGEGGQCVLESLVVPTDSLQPRPRYARMSNVWCVPTTAQLLAWMSTAGFQHCKVVDETTTTTQEQRSTPWMHFESLQQALHPGNPSLTIEGYPAPRRAILIGQK